VAGLAALCASVHLEGGGVGNYIFAGAIFVGAWLAGFILRSRHLHAEALEERALALEQDQDARARAAVAEERARIARDLHDAVAHSMSVIAVQAGAERLALPREAASTREVLQSIEETSRQALVEMRRLVEMLRKDDEELALAPQPSLEHLQLLVDQVREAGLPVELRIEGEPRLLPPGVDLSAYRIVQEALTNALKHAGPARARVTVRYAPAQLELEVSDDGIGSTSRADSGGHGLVGMRERVAVFGGALQATPRVEGGFCLRATLPLRPATP
jgi:signal transduction histidine kinase